MIILLSVPHTGTRFTIAFLKSIKVIHLQYHTSASMMDEIQHLFSTKAIIPVRDPLLAYISTMNKCNMSSPKDFYTVLNNIVMEYKLLLLCQGVLGTETTAPKPWFDEIHYLRLDAEDTDLEMRKAADFCGYEGPVNFKWEPVGNDKPDPTSYAVWDVVSGHFPAGEKQRVLDALKPFREHYGYGS